MLKTALITTALLTSTLVATTTLAAGRYVQAPVVDVQPIYETYRISEPREVCWDERVTYRRTSPVPAILGGIIGGVVGNQFGGGNGRKAFTAAGAVIGASAMHNAAARSAPRRVAVEQRCEIERDYREEERLTGFRVWYELAGETYVTTMPHEPGETIRVRVSVTPAE